MRIDQPVLKQKEIEVPQFQPAGLFPLKTEGAFQFARVRVVKIASLVVGVELPVWVFDSNDRGLVDVSVVLEFFSEGFVGDQKANQNVSHQVIVSVWELE